MIVEELVPAGTVLIREGDRAHAFFVLLTGAAVVERNGEAIGCLEPDAIFGELALLTYQRRTATVTTTAPSRILTIPEGTFRHLVETDRSFSRRVFAAAAARA
jgi:CRP-like cAMP-binding protein